MYEQLSMFQEQSSQMVGQLVHDQEGGIWYHPFCVDEATAQSWFRNLMADTAWHAEQRPMYDRIVNVPRLMASISVQDPRRPVFLDEALAAVQALAPAPYTRVGLNLYRNERDSVAMHNDRLPDLVPGWPIAILSLGAAREMMIRAKARGPVQRVTLAPGSLLVMSHASQRTHDHGIPKCKDARAPRISLAFRVRARGA